MPQYENTKQVAPISGNFPSNRATYQCENFASVSPAIKISH